MFGKTEFNLYPLSVKQHETLCTAGKQVGNMPERYTTKRNPEARWYAGPGQRPERAGAFQAFAPPCRRARQSLNHHHDY